VADSERVVWQKQNDAQGCGGTTTATGTFSTNGAGGTVRYNWVRKDSSGTRVIAEPVIVIAAGDRSSHAVVSDVWSPASSGTEQLVFLAPGAQAPAAQSITGSFTCTG
jgi:hypothetical protein